MNSELRMNDLSNIDQIIVRLEVSNVDHGLAKL